MRDLRPTRRSTAGLLALALVTLVVAACAATASASSTPTAPPPDAPVTAPPIGDGGSPPIDGDAKVVTPRPGQLDVHPVSAETLTANVDGRSVVLAIDWWSGVEPCSILDTIVVDRGEASFAITLLEGRGPGEVACIAIAERHRAFVDLGELDPGTYSVSDATGGAPAIEFVIS